MAPLDMFYTLLRLVSLSALSLTSPNILIFIAIPRAIFGNTSTRILAWRMMRTRMKYKTVSLNSVKLQVGNSPIPGHCFEHTRQYIMCAGDLTPLPTKLSPILGRDCLNGPHICRNFEKLQD
jgi:Mycotoxin biosynthesis protein UstYa